MIQRTSIYLNGAFRGILRALEAKLAKDLAPILRLYVSISLIGVGFLVLLSGHAH